MDTALDDAIKRLETRRMATEGLRCTWCPSCHRIFVRDPLAKKKVKSELILQGSDTCQKPMSEGTITECINDLRCTAQ